MYLFWMDGDVDVDLMIQYMLPEALSKKFPYIQMASVVPVRVIEARKEVTPLVMRAVWLVDVVVSVVTTVTVSDKTAVWVVSVVAVTETTTVWVVVVVAVAGMIDLSVLRMVDSTEAVTV